MTFRRSSPLWNPLKKLLLIVLLLGIGAKSAQEFEQLKQRMGCEALSVPATKMDIPLNDFTRVKFVAMGDTGNASVDQKRVAQAVKKICQQQGCDFVMLLGDNFYEDGLINTEDNLIEKAFNEMYADIPVPFVAVLGNHDLHNSPLTEVMLSLKNKQWKMPNYFYSFELGPVRFQGINSNCHVFGLAQLDFGTQQQKVPWQVVFAHHPMFSTGTHGDADILYRQFWLRQYDQQAQFYLAGHDHHLEHLQAEDYNTQFIVSGSGGKHYRNSKKSDRLEKSTAKSLFEYSDNGFVWLEFDATTAQAQFYDSNANKIYEFQRKL